MINHSSRDPNAAVPLEAGFEVVASLNGEPVATDISVTVDEADYYALHVHSCELTSSAEESEVEREGQREVVSPTLGVFTVSGRPGRWYVSILHTK